MSVTSFVIHHNRELDGPFPLEQMGTLPHVICHVDDIDDKLQKVAIIVNNTRNEDIHAIVFELGRLVNAASQVYKTFVDNGRAN